jgi:3-dehydroquinate dehydratase-2
MKPLVFVLNGPNLNLLGLREPQVYGHETLADIEAMCARIAAELGVVVDFRQTNHEGVLVDWIQEARGKAAGMIINPGAYTHTSIAIHDALRALDAPVIELHLSNVFAREPFRHHSYVSPVAKGVMCGFGANGYQWALRALSGMIMPASKAAR